MSDDTCRTRRSCRCSRWDHYRNRFGYFISDAYANGIYNSGPIAYWPLWEATGSIAHCLINPAQNGTYNSPVQTWPPIPGIGDGNTAPYFDGVNDLVDIFTPALQAVFPGNEGSLLYWFQVANAGIWTDGVGRNAFFVADTTTWTDYLWSGRPAANNSMQSWRQVAAGPAAVLSGCTSTDWVCCITTWSQSANQIIIYLDAVPVAPGVGLGPWTQTIDAAYIGQQWPGTFQWHGGIAHVALWDRVLVAGEVTAICTI